MRMLPPALTTIRMGLAALPPSCVLLTSIWVIEGVPSRLAVTPPIEPKVTLEAVLSGAGGDPLKGVATALLVPSAPERVWMQVRGTPDWHCAHDAASLTVHPVPGRENTIWTAAFRWIASIRAV